MVNKLKATTLQVEMACFSYVLYLTDGVSQAILVIVNSILFICSVTGNSLVIYLVWSKASLRLPTYLLMSFLALSDLLTSLFGQSLYCISLNILKDLSCTIVRATAFMNVANCASSLLLLSLIARDRYLHVSQRQSYLDHTSNRFAITSSIACYLLGTTVGSLFVFDNRIIEISGTVAFAVLGNSSFIYICLKSRQIMRIIQDHVEQIEANRQNTSDLEEIAFTRSSIYEKAVNKSIFVVIILFFVSWTPVIILMIIFTVYNIRNEPITDGYRIAFNWASTPAYLNGALNHVIYSYRCDAIGREIRKKVAKVFGRANIAPFSIQQEFLQRNVELKYHREVEQNKGVETDMAGGALALPNFS